MHYIDALNIKSIFHQICPKELPEERACLIWALSTIIGIPNKRVIIQAGTCLWPCTAPDMDDGVSPTHFGYEWNPNDPFSRILHGLHKLPEMHVWAGIPEESIIIDFTTKYFITNAEQMLGINWTAKNPPEYLYTDVKDMPHGVVYRPNLSAYLLAQEAAVNFINDFNLPKELIEKI